MGSETLLPCPFCGGEATISTKHDEDIWSHNIVPWTYVGCRECEFEMVTCEGVEPSAQAMWNRRAAPEGAL